MNNTLRTTILILLALTGLAEAYYAPQLGRFLRRDPIEERGGTNVYAFARNDSVNNWDRLGLKIVYATKACEAKTKKMLTKIKANSSVMKELIERLEASKHFHRLDCSKSTKNVNRDANPQGYCHGRIVNKKPSGYNKNKTNGVGVSTRTWFSRKPKGGYSVESVLAHELTHADQKDAGRLPKDRSEREKEAMDNANDYRDGVGEATRPYIDHPYIDQDDVDKWEKKAENRKKSLK